MGAIKYYQSAQNGAPTLSGQNGSLISVLDAILVNGYGQVSITSITRSGTTATVTTTSAHLMLSGDVAAIAGANETDYNGEFVITVTGASTFTITVANSPATPATGTITVKRAPAGFTKVYSGTNKAVYRSNDVTGLRHYLQVIDAGTTTGGAKEAQVRAFITMSDVDTGIEPFPTVAQSSFGVLCHKSNAINGTSRPWKLITDGKTFYFAPCVDQNPASLIEASGGYVWFIAFGELIPTYPSDPYCSFLAGCNTQNAPTSSNQNGLFCAAIRTYNSVSTGISMPRDWNNSVGAVWTATIGHGWDQSAAGNLALFTYPHPQDNGFYMTKCLMAQRGTLRGVLPGVFEPLQGRCLQNYDTIENIDGYSGRKFIALWGVNGTTSGMLMFDMTGPWS